MIAMVQSLFGIPQPKALSDQSLSSATSIEQDSISTESIQSVDTSAAQRIRDLRRLRRTAPRAEERITPLSDSTKRTTAPKSDSTALKERDTLHQRRAGGGLTEIIEGKNTDSLIYDIRTQKVYIYNQGDLKYADKSLQADFMRINMENKEIHAYGKPDTVDGRPTKTQPVFADGGASYTMDTITYNFSSEKALIKGVATQQGDGWLVGGRIKKQPDNTINIQHGKYTTCDHTDHPHF